ncbi:hypothetical protein SAMN04515671_4535 [Nakamurella panacisegetis]|uniref:LPXTG-motif cell wall anchor domain-containing protein n=1 Tax=Nakamurella panacisegetis TaxID=1090615 RepID=A0A1H0TA68_9ACTN|nr:hypothetical protein [Nakamurella panacisegetis]SDP50508.1 hypothetical protein SAMN04515671_4535 [Nakamurella panacisegetis]
MRMHKLLVTAALVVAPMTFALGTASAGAPAPTFTISPNPATPGSTVVFSGTGCRGQETDPEGKQPHVTLYAIDVTPTLASAARPARQFKAADNQVVAVVPVNPDGTWSFTPEPIPDPYPSAEIDFGATCDTYTDSFQYKPVTFTINGNVSSAAMFLPDFLMDTPILNAGKSYDVDALGFEPGETVDLYIHSTPVKIASYVADADGVIDTKKFTIPLDTVGGAHTLELVGESSAVTTSLAIEVMAAPVNTTTTVTATTTVPTMVPATSGDPATTTSTTAGATTTTGAPILASTGVSAAPQMTAVGLLLTLGGLGTLLFARRRGSRSH